MHSMPIITIIIPAYNHSKYIDDLVRSILGQSFEMMEILITDDCSTDDTYRKIESWLPKLEKRVCSVKLFRNDVNQGMPITLNKMLKMARGKYVKVLSSDDFLLPGAIENMVSFMENNQECGLCFSNGYIGDENTHYPMEEYSELEKYYKNIPSIDDTLIERLYKEYFFFTPSVIFRKKICEKIGYFDENIWFEDWDYYLRIASNSEVRYLNVATILYRLIDSSASHSTKLENRIGMRSSEIYVLIKHQKLVSSEVAEKAIFQKCNEVFKEAFDMRSRSYIEQIDNTMKENSIKKTIVNFLLWKLYKSNLLNQFFS